MCTELAYGESSSVLARFALEMRTNERIKINDLFGDDCKNEHVTIHSQ